MASKPWPDIHNQIEFQEHTFILESEAYLGCSLWDRASTLGIFPTKYFEIKRLYLKLTCSLTLPCISRSLNSLSLLPSPAVL